MTSDLSIGLRFFYRGTSLIRKRLLLGPAAGLCLRHYGGPRGGGLFHMSEVPLYPTIDHSPDQLDVSA